MYGLTGFGLGAYAEYKCMKATDSKHGCLALKPTNLTYEEATVAAYGGLLALQFMDRGAIRPGQRVLVYGASSTSGTTAVQYAKHLGAEVTGVCSTANLELVRSLGADHVIDYTKVDALEPGDRYDFVLDAVGKAKTSRLKDSCRASVPGREKYVSIDDGALLLESARLAKVRELVEAGTSRRSWTGAIRSRRSSRPTGTSGRATSAGASRSRCDAAAPARRRQPCFAGRPDAPASVDVVGLDGRVLALQAGLQACRA